MSYSQRLITYFTSFPLTDAQYKSRMIYYYFHSVYPKYTEKNIRIGKKLELQILINIRALDLSGSVGIFFFRIMSCLSVRI